MHNFSEYSTWQEQKLVVGSSGRYCQSSQVTIKSNEQHTQEGERGRRGDRTPAGGAPPRRLAAPPTAALARANQLDWGGVGWGVRVWGFRFGKHPSMDMTCREVERNQKTQVNANGSLPTGLFTISTT